MFVKCTLNEMDRCKEVNDDFKLQKTDNYNLLIWQHVHFKLLS